MSAFALSAKTGEGVSELVDLLANSAEEGLAVGEPAVITRARHRAELEAAAEASSASARSGEGRKSRPRSSASPPAISAA